MTVDDVFVISKREIGVSGALVIDAEAITDSRGYFARLHSSAVLRGWGITDDFLEVSVSYNDVAGTLRGLHYQRAPFEEAKLVWCPNGAVYDVLLDMRPDSLTYRTWCAVELDRATSCLYVPRGVAHGYQTLRPATLVHYQISVPYHHMSAAGVRYDDPELGIPWPIQPPTRLSERDGKFPSLRDTLSNRASWLRGERS